jgi:hypothetical protein
MLRDDRVHAAAWRSAKRAYDRLAREIPGLRASRYFTPQPTRRVETEQDLAAMTGALTRLAAEVAAPACEVTLIVRGGLWRPSLVIRNRAVAVRTTEITADADWFWWPMGHRLCAVADPAGAARTIMSILRLGPEGGD